MNEGEKTFNTILNITIIALIIFGVIMFGVIIETILQNKMVAEENCQYYLK